MKRITVILFLLSVLAACVPQTGSEGFGAPEIVEAEAAVAGVREAVLRCTLSEPRAERCGFAYGEAGGPLREVECELAGSSFGLHLKSLRPEVVYEWYAFIRAGDQEVRSKIKRFEIEWDGNGPRDDELWYVTVSGRPLDLERDSLRFNVPVVSNTYDNNLGTITFAGALRWIEEWTFNMEDDLLEVTIPSGVEELGYSSFRECLNLKRLSIMPGLKKIGDTAFHNCQKLSEIILPDTIYIIDKDAFSHCFSLETIDLPLKLERLEQSAFLNCTSLKSITIPETVVSIGYRAFDNDSSLTRIVCLPKVPPAGSEMMFTNTSSAPIYVPAESVEAYRSARYWRQYADRIHSIEDER